MMVHDAVGVWKLPMASNGFQEFWQLQPRVLKHFELLSSGSHRTLRKYDDPRLGGWLPQEAREGPQGAQGLELALSLMDGDALPSFAKLS